MKYKAIIPTSALVLGSLSNLLMNYIALVPGVPTRMHFTDHYYIDREIADRETGKPKTIKSLVFWVDTLEGEPCSRTFSVLSQKLAAHLEPFLAGKEYLKYELIITQMGSGFLKDWTIQPILLPEE